MALFLVEPKAQRQQPEPRLTSYRFWERFSPEELAAIARKIAIVQDDRDRQGDLFAPSAETGNEGGAAPAAPSTAAAPAVSQPKNETLGTLLSPSQVKCFLGCSARWWFRYGLGLPDQRGGSLVRGAAVDKTVMWALRNKLQGVAYEVEDAGEVYEAAWDAECENASFAPDESPEELKRSGAILARKYLEEAVPEIEPRDVQLKVAGEIAGVKVQGFVDLIDTSGRIIDLKTAAKSPSGIDSDYRFQLATYRQLAPGASGEARLDTVVATKVPKLVRIDYTVSVADQLMTQHLYPHVREGIREGLYFPNRSSNLCSRKYCAFADACCKEFGGAVE